MTIFKSIDAAMTEKGAIYMGDTHVYNVHNFNNQSKISALSLYLKTLPTVPGGFYYAAIVGTIGRTAHSKTALHVYQVPQDQTIHDLGRDYFYNYDGNETND